MADTETLSAEDLRNRLYHTLKEKGLVDTLKVADHCRAMSTAYD